jgi:redox-sensing transcriptional repressor
LPIYLRGLLFLSEEGQQSISSRDLADFLGANPWQIRKDFSYFGGFGTPGVGYNIEKLARQIKKILKLDVVHRAALVRVGNLGSIILAYPGFRIYGFDIVAAFDTDSKKNGRKVNTITADLIKVIDLARQLGKCPAEIIIFGIEPQVVKPGCELSKILTNRFDEYVTMIRKELSKIISSPS